MTTLTGIGEPVAAIHEADVPSMLGFLHRYMVLRCLFPTPVPGVDSPGDQSDALESRPSEGVI
jgi:hypothetical protein